MATLCVVAILLTINSLDAIREIPPLADDYWMIASAPGQIAREYFADYGWGRFIGIWLVDLTNSVRSLTGASLVVVLLVLRALVLAGVYVTLRRLFTLGEGASLLAVGLMAWTPPAFEGWALLCNVHLAVSAIPVLVACGLFARSVDAVRAEPVTTAYVGVAHSMRWRWVLGAAGAQLVANFVYEQALLAVPAFVLVLVAVGPGARAPRRARLTALTAATGVALVTAVAMLMSGYVGRRSVATSSPAEVSDLTSALGAMWIGFGQHHLWRAIEVVRAKQALWWDASVLGVVAGIATLAASVGIALQLVRDRSPRALGPGPSLSLAALAAAYAALLPTGLAYPGYTIFSRLYYVPGVFMGVAIATLAHAPWRVPRVALAMVAGVAMLWLGIVTRRYYEDMRQGSQILRVVARSVAAVPAAVRRGGLLVVAPSNVGTFSTSAVEPWSLRPAVRQLTGVNPEGALLLTSDCAELARDHPRVNQESERARPTTRSDAVGAERWAAVLRYESGGVQIAPSVAAACAR